MKQLFKNKFFIIVLCVTLALVILIPSALALFGAGDPGRGVINTLLSPVQKLFHAVADAVDGFASYFTEFDSLVEENDRLREELRQLREKTEDAEALENENEWLRRYLDLRDENPSFEMLPATITGRSAAGAPTVFTLDKGTSSGVSERMPVITNDGIVGYVSEVGPNWCKVQTLIESTSSIGVYVKRTGAAGILEGSYDLAEDGLCVLRYLPADTDIHEGDCILSSGYGTVYPRGLTVGHVISVELDPFSRAPIAYVSLSADIASATRVMILTAYETTIEP